MVGREKGGKKTMETITFCAFCGKEIKYDPELFAAGKTGESVCDDCQKEEEEVK